MIVLYLAMLTVQLVVGIKSFKNKEMVNIYNVTILIANMCCLMTRIGTYFYWIAFDDDSVKRHSVEYYFDY